MTIDSKGRILALTGALLVWCVCSVATAEEPDDVEAARSIEASTSATAEVAKYEFRSPDGEIAELLQQPVLKWSNPAAGSIYGNVFIWTESGRPFVAGSLFQWFSPFTHGSHEFVSLATTPLSARYEGEDIWQTMQPGVTLAPLPGAPQPAGSPALRLVQMRSLMRQFSATKVDREGQQQELRPLTQPVYRYPASDSGPLDGGLFVFVQGTDPEVWLMLEATERKGELQWEFAAAPMNSVEFTLKRHGSEIWHVDIRAWAKIQSHREPYTSFRFGELPQ